MSSPVERYRLPSPSKTMSPPTWQQMPRSTGTSRICSSEPRSMVSVRSSHWKRERRMTPLKRSQSARRAEERRVALVDRRRRRVVDGRVQGRRVVQVDPPVLLEVGVERDVLQPLLVVLVHVELSGERLQAGVRIVQPNMALARDVQHAAVRQHGQVHRLTRRVVDDDLLELRVGRRRLSRSDRRAGPKRQHAGDGNEYSRGSHAVSS